MARGRLAAEAASGGAWRRRGGGGSRRPGLRGVMRMPRSSIEMSRPSSGLSVPGFFGFSILMTGSLRGLGGLGGRIGSSTVSVTVHLNSGSDDATPARISSSSDSRKKRFQLMPTSQLA